MTVTTFKTSLHFLHTRIAMTRATIITLSHKRNAARDAIERAALNSTIQRSERELTQLRDALRARLSA